MGRQKEREEFVAVMAREVPLMDLDDVRRLMRAATTLHRLAEAECNGDDWRDEHGPRHFRATDNRDKAVCGEAWDGAVMTWRRWNRVTCSNCKAWRVEQRVKALCAQYGVVPVFNGDPRGAVLKLAVPSGYTNDWGQTGLCVP